VHNLKFYEDFKPKKKYRKTLKEYIRKYYPIADDHCIDLLDRMLNFNPSHRITAKAALDHPFFKNEPLACKPS
jgi:serine/threonine protein kinase